MPGRLGMDKDISTEQKTWQVYNFGKRNVFRLDLNECRGSFCRRGRGRSSCVDGLKTEKAQEPAVESLVQGIWRLRLSEAEQRVQEESTGEYRKSMGGEYRKRVQEENTGREYRRRVQEESTGGEYGRRKRVQEESTGGEYRKRVQEESTGGEYRRRIQEESTGGEYGKKIQEESVGGEYRNRVWEESTGGEYGRRVWEENAGGECGRWIQEQSMGREYRLSSVILLAYRIRCLFWTTTQL